MIREKVDGFKNKHKHAEMIVCYVVAIALIVFFVIELVVDLGERERYVGKWHATTAKYNDIEIDVEDALGGEFTIALKKNGSCTVSVAGKEANGDWEVTDNGIEFEDDEDGLQFIQEDNKLKTNAYGVTLFFEKSM